MNATNVLELLVRNEKIDQAEADSVMEEIKEGGADIVETLVNFDVIEDEEELWRFVAEDLQAEYIDLKDYLPPTELISTIPAGLARLYGALPGQLRYQRSDGCAHRSLQSADGGGSPLCAGPGDRGRGG